MAVPVVVTRTLSEMENEMHDSMARLIGARETARRLLYSDSGNSLSWPVAATPYRNALVEVLKSIDEIVSIERYPVNPDFPGEGYDLHAEIRPGLVGATISR